MRILHVVPTYLPAVRYGGPIISVHGLCKGLARQNHEVHVFTTNVDGPLNSPVPLGTPVNLDGVHVWYFPCVYLRRLYWSVQMAEALTNNMRRFDIAHIHSIYLWPTWAAARAARRERVPYMLAPRGMLEKDLIRRRSRLVKSAWINVIEKRNLENACAIHVTSEREAEEAKKFSFRFPQFVIVPNGVDLDLSSRDYAADLPVSDGMLLEAPFMLFIGRISWKKGLDRLISSLAHAPDVHLVIAGNDEENYRPILEALAQKEGVSRRLTFAGPVRGGAKSALLANARALVLPSYSENFGNVVLEAMAAGCPVLVTPEVGLSTLVRETDCGRVVSGDPEGFGGAMNELFHNDAALREMGLRGRRVVEERYSWTVVAQQMENAYHRFVARDRT